MASPDRPRASRPKRRTFTREYKMSVLEQYEAASTPQERNGLLRREGIYSAYITEWRRERDCAAAAPVPERKPGRPAKNPAEAENEKLRKEKPFTGKSMPPRPATSRKSVRPELVADAPDQVWTWDITKSFRG